ncbi:MAG TPA: o-succinylbenzoate--CoA ligase [Actinomycetes bacterium]|nr:o-succinylbenzoate--CoA ligase [Actinomycetes bacterium]
MSTDHLLTLDAPVTTEDVDRFLPHLQRALAGTGPAVHASSSNGSNPAALQPGSATPLAPSDFDGIALLVSTSGSTGAPKLAMLSRDAVMASVNATHSALGGAGRWLLMVPTSHVAGIQVLSRSVVAGYPPVVLDLSAGFRPTAFVEAVGRLLDDIGPEPRYTSLVPTQLRRILDAGGAAVAGLMALDAVLLGGSAAAPRLLDRAHGAGITIVQSYGMTETCAGCVYDGVPLEGVDVKLGEAGRIQISGPMVFSGYLGEPELTQEAIVGGSLMTNDIGRFDERGRLLVLGRLDDVVVTGGLNVSCSAVELVLAEHPSIREVVVVGIPDDEWGQRLVAVATAEKSLTLADLKTYALGRLDRHELPRELVLVPKLPWLAAGKPDRAAVRSLVQQ